MKHLHLEDNPNDSPLNRNADWFRATGQMPLEPKPDARQTAFYTGMQCEELAEKLTTILSPAHPTVQALHQIGYTLKAGYLDTQVQVAMLEQPKALLDGDVDLLWVTVGSSQAMGSDLPGAHGEVATRNWAKRWPDGTFHRDPVTGKVLKPEGWVGPDLTPFIHPTLINS